jgi:hypothetical protein
VEQLPERSFEQLDPYNHSFVETVLQLQGVIGSASLQEFKAALRTLGTYYEELAAAFDRGDPVDEDWLDGPNHSAAGREHAFYFVMFGTVTLPTAEQQQALERWLGHPAQFLH